MGMMVRSLLVTFDKVRNPRGAIMKPLRFNTDRGYYEVRINADISLKLACPGPEFLQPEKQYQLDIFALQKEEELLEMPKCQSQSARSRCVFEVSKPQGIYYGEESADSQANRIVATIQDYRLSNRSNVQWTSCPVTPRFKDKTSYMG